MMSLIDRYFLKQPRLRWWVTRLLEGDRERDVSVLGTTLRVHSIKEHGYLRSSRLANSSALLREELPVLINLASLLRDGDTFVDIGANVGVYCLTLARIGRIQPRTTFHAFEANPDTFTRLAAGAARLGVHAHHLALSDHTGTLQFVAGAVSHVFTTVENTNTYSLGAQPVSVPCRRLDELDLPGDSFIFKIDVEGQETAVLNGARALFEAKRVKAVYLDGYRDREIEGTLRDWGFTLLDGKTLEPTAGGVFSLLALRP